MSDFFEKRRGPCGYTGANPNEAKDRPQFVVHVQLVGGLRWPRNRGAFDRELVSGQKIFSTETEIF